MEIGRAVSEGPDELDPGRLSRQVKVTRETFEKAFDAFAEVSPDERIPFKAVALKRQRAAPLGPGRERDFADFEAALRYASDKGFLQGFCSAGGATLFKASSEDDGTGGVVMAAALVADARDRASVLVTFEAIVNDQERFRDPDDVNAAVMRAQRCTCRIVVRDGARRTRGTGFLIGPRLVLTNWHVVRSLLEPMSDEEAAAAGLAPAESWKAAAGSAARLGVEFDFTARAAQAGGVIRIGVIENWLVAASSAEGSERTGSEGAGDWPADGADFEPYDDFAVIEIAEPAGLERRFYDIVSEDPPMPRGNMVLLHHPGEFSMRLSYGSFDLGLPAANLLGGVPAKTSARILHSANSIGGSSGAPCFNFDMMPVALHQAGVTYGGNSDISDDNGDPVPSANVNIAIPLRRIRAKAGPAIIARMGALQALKPALSNGDPLIGRGELQEAIAEASRGKVKILIVRADLGVDGKPLQRVGKSFSRRILREFLDLAEHEIVEISAANLMQNAYRTAAALLEAVSAGRSSALTPVDDSSLPADRQSTEINDVVMRVAGELKAELVRIAGQRTLWLVIDELEKHALPDTTTRTLLDRLYADVSVEPSLRLVMLGLVDVDLPSLQGIKAKRLEKPLTHLDSSRVASWVGNRVDGRFGLPDVACECLAAVVSSVASSRVSETFSMTQAVAAVVRNDLDPHLKKRMGV
ncbi:hypothetical protein CO662_32255 [Rhizobium anhuiense]|uniref:Trypsin-like peptidase domain-containing protein n=3 Tax=Rhizobium TaxID=379 RepID=A0A1C3Y9W0_9HYPH|nr:hypothetical protein CO648_27535 [Rhizobium phaseoli]PDS34570.1 hypothetical protein CO665_29755 [Rhizobium anhuiense]PDS81765.1 hypothetical protein CO654_28220 [Rhizobium sp. L18]PDT26561.1 hypothetical protein CO660_27415 [Rhizobium sp. L9]PDV85777.1 hypothetical protein CO652_25275 [Rhizobium sp. H4]RSB87266.1 hypothetical protein EFR00_26930 [Rhizobium sophoriradicis]RUM03642.1 hypothetical protein EFR84_19285 [Rhizobium chutanense]SCB61302.1 Trypsin-like peptidase domain-containing 